MKAAMEREQMESLWEVNIGAKVLSWEEWRGEGKVGEGEGEGSGDDE